jgi:hypothetical protein
MDVTEKQQKAKRVYDPKDVAHFKRLFARLVQTLRSFPELCKKLGPSGRMQAFKECSKTESFFSDFSIPDDEATRSITSPLSSFLYDIAGPNSEGRWDGILPELTSTQGK